MEADSTTGMKRKSEEQGGSKRQKGETSLDIGSDGSAPGGHSFTLMPTIASQNIWVPFTIHNRKLITMRNLTDYCNFLDPCRALYIDPTISSTEFPPGLTVAPIQRFTGNKLKLSNLIITNDSLNIQSGTPMAATSFNDSPYLLLFRDRTNSVLDITAASQFSTADDTVAANWSLTDLRDRSTFTDLSVANQAHMNCDIWKMGDNAYNFSFQPCSIDVAPNDNGVMPFANFNNQNFVRNTIDSENNFPFTVNTNYPIFCTLPAVADTTGDIKFGCNFIMEQTVTGYALVSTDGNPIFRNVSSMSVYAAGTRPTFGGDVRSHNTPIEVIT